MTYAFGLFIFLVVFIAGHLNGYRKGIKDPKDRNGYYRKRTWKDWLPWG